MSASLSGKKRWRGNTPLWPAGHLPHKEGDYAFIDVRQQSQVSQDKREGQCQPISTLVGEMPGRAEGG
ncbi:lytic murein transglycosylase [Phyllobacterium phragmitis]|uniref:Lytic murein transglycosylase n=1 Tax=Phyllobacterium phragmitis TaxID=2670329 RepID=A0A2S9ISA1_9HYPH|nr:lytic murein transglycosylase [Phyllobacterium phragmitis]